MKQKFLRYMLISIFTLTAFTALIISCNTTSAQNEISKDGINFFSGSLDSALILAKQENKPIFIMVHANWCAVCKKMKKEVLLQKVLGDFYNSHFLSVMVDFDSEEGTLIKKQFEIMGTPTFLFLSADGDLINKTSGYQGTSELINAAKNLKMGGKAVCN